LILNFVVFSPIGGLGHRKGSVRQIFFCSEESLCWHIRKCQ